MRTRGVSSILILAATLAFGATASAETLRYKWRDAEGNLHYSDSLPSNAGVLGYDVVNSQGILVKRSLAYPGLRGLCVEQGRWLDPRRPRHVARAETGSEGTGQAGNPAPE